MTWHEVQHLLGFCCIWTCSVAFFTTFPDMPAVLSSFNSHLLFVRFKDFLPYWKMDLSYSSLIQLGVSATQLHLTFKFTFLVFTHAFVFLVIIFAFTFTFIFAFTQEVCDTRKLEGASLSLTLCHDSHIAYLNEEYRGISKPTDVLSFELGREYIDTTCVLGDVIISLDTAAR